MIDKFILIVLGVICILLFCFSFTAAYIIAQFTKPKEQAKPTVVRELTEEEKRKAARLRREVVNMLTYTGEPQEEIHVD